MYNTKNRINISFYFYKVQSELKNEKEYDMTDYKINIINIWNYGMYGGNMTMTFLIARLLVFHVIHTSVTTRHCRYVDLNKIGPTPRDSWDGKCYTIEHDYCGIFIIYGYVVI